MNALIADSGSRTLMLNATAEGLPLYEKLGFELGNCWPDAHQPEYASLVLDRQVVMVAASLSEKAAKERGASKSERRRIKKDHKAFKKHRHGVGVRLYLCVPDPDAHHRQALRRKVEVLRSPTTHAYGIRDYVAADPDGYQLAFFARAEDGVEITPHGGVLEAGCNAGRTFGGRRSGGRMRGSWPTGYWRRFPNC